MDSPIEKLSARIQEIDSVHPSRIRQQLLETLRDFVPSDAGLFVKCIQVGDDSRYFTCAVCVGDSDIRDELLGSIAERPAFPTPWLPPNLDPDEINTFIRVRERYESLPLRDFRKAREIFDKLGIRDQLRAVFVDDNRLLGWLGLLRRDPDYPFSRMCQRSLDDLVPLIKSKLVEAEELENSAVAERQCAVFGPDGGILFRSPSLKHWLTDERRARLQGRIRDFHECKQDHRVDVFDGATVDLLRMLSRDDEVCYLASIDPPRLLTIDPSYWLTNRQLEVARYVMSGATSPEIAAELHVSVETVKSHIKNIFERLDISSRAELAAILSGSISGMDIT